MTQVENTPAINNTNFDTKAAALTKLENEIKQLEELQRNSELSDAGVNPQNPQSNPQQNPDDGRDTSGTIAPATSEEEQTYRKRYTDLKTYHDKQIHESRLKVAALERQVANAGKAAPQTEEELEEFRKKNPEMFSTMEALLNKNNSGISHTQMDELKEELASIRQEKAVVQIQNKHPDFYDVVSSDTWSSWLESQPKNIKKMVEGNTDDAASFIRAIDLYKFDNGGATSTTPSQPRNLNNTSNTQQAPSAADAVQTTGTGDVSDSNKRIWTTTEIDKMSLQEYEIFQEDINKARKEGRIRDTKNKH